MSDDDRGEATEPRPPLLAAIDEATAELIDVALTLAPGEPRRRVEAVARSLFFAAQAAEAEQETGES